jgi:hypothetical protein
MTHDLAKTSSPPPQADTTKVSDASIMRMPEFRRGVEEYRAGKPPNFESDHDWGYERGRQWAAYADRHGHSYLKPSPRGLALDVFRRAIV